MNELEQELEELYKDLEALEIQYNDNSIKSESKFLIWDDIKYTKEQIEKVEQQINQMKGSKTR